MNTNTNITTAPSNSAGETKVTIGWATIGGERLVAKIGAAYYVVLHPGLGRLRKAPLPGRPHNWEPETVPLFANVLAEGLINNNPWIA